MNMRKIIILCIILILTTNLIAKEKGINLSQRFSSKDSTELVPTNPRTYKKVLSTLKGLSFIETPKTIGKIKEEFKAINANEEIKNKEDAREAKRKALQSIFINNPSSLLSLLWPLFLIFFVIWFLKQYKKVFIKKIEF